jgi:histidinol-phosphate/aromatic aminotransferase/cobyric acid decarboxylase-like protein
MKPERYAPPYCGSFPNVMILNAFMKFCGMAGLRLGFLMGEKSP